MDEMESQMSMQGLGGGNNMHHNGGGSQASQFQS